MCTERLPLQTFGLEEQDRSTGGTKREIKTSFLITVNNLCHVNLSSNVRGAAAGYKQALVFTSQFSHPPRGRQDAMGKQKIYLGETKGESRDELYSKMRRV
ncbi:hypothetical protein RRG08_000612 [Elysia crispata]|uniref:Uncharacterized protein n=1 Tax=Elysia crispata TaxID=231223 RepID=A0AAE1CUZ6_9GAST|nr:hypothetical protein RRG08_000612 [Elysia crispata]